MSKRWETRKTLPPIDISLVLTVNNVNYDIHMCRLESNSEISIGIMPVFTPFKRTLPNEIQPISDWFGVATGVNDETRSIIIRPFDTIRNRKILNELNPKMLHLTEVCSEKTEYTRVKMDDDSISIGNMSTSDSLIGFMLNLPDDFSMPYVVEHMTETDLWNASNMSHMVDNIVHHMHKEGWNRIRMEIYKEE